MAIAEELKVVVRAEVDKAVRDMQRFQKSTDQNTKSVAGLSKGMVAAGAAVAGAVVAFRQIVRVGGELLTAWSRQEQAVSRLDAVMTATGEAAGFTTDELVAQAAALQDVTTYGDEAIIEMQAILGTFKSLQGEGFQRTQELALDLSAAFGQDLKSSAIQLGKALEDPTTGLTALRRIGVSFTESQEDMIKSLTEAGKQAEAQAIILETLEGQVGGVAEAIGNTTSGQRQGLANAFGDLKEAAGAWLDETLRPMYQPLTDVVQKFTEWVTEIANAKRELNDLNELIEGSAFSGEVAETGVQEIERRIEAYKRGIETQRDLLQAAIERRDQLIEQQSLYREGSVQYQQYTAGIDLATSAVNDERDTLQDLIKELYNLELALENAKAQQEGLNEAVLEGKEAFRGAGANWRDAPKAPTSTGTIKGGAGRGPFGIPSIDKFAEEVVEEAVEEVAELTIGISDLITPVNQMNKIFTGELIPNTMDYTDAAVDFGDAFAEALPVVKEMKDVVGMQLPNNIELYNEALQRSALRLSAEERRVQNMINLDETLAAAQEAVAKETKQLRNDMLQLADSIAGSLSTIETGNEGVDYFLQDLASITDIIAQLGTGNVFGAIAAIIETIIGWFTRAAESQRELHDSMEDAADAAEDLDDALEDVTEGMAKMYDEWIDMQRDAIERMRRELDQEFDVLYDAWQRNLITTEEFTEGLEGLNDQAEDIEDIGEMTEAPAQYNVSEVGAQYRTEGAFGSSKEPVVINILGDTYGTDELIARVEEGLGTAKRRGLYGGV